MLRAIIHRTLTTCNKINAINVASAVTNSDILLNNVAEKKELPDEDDEYEEMFVKTTFNNIEWGGPLRGGRMPEPTRFGDWERKGRCTDY
tara:strand:- start:637 stop:906 length:270 start_codon:yes stop_codon:yes gene_type:complete